MASFLVGSFAFNMATWDLSDIANGTVTSDGATEVDVSGHSGLFVYTITGSGFTTFDTNGFPTDGTVTGVTMAVPGKAPMTIAGVSIAATDFMGFVNAHDTTGLETAIFAGNDAFVGRAGSDTLLGFGGNDTFNLSKGGNDTANGGDGNDTFNMGGAMTAADTIDGGTGTDKLTLNGDYSAGLTMGAATMVNVETMTMIGNHDYNVTFSAASDTVGQSLNVSAAALTVAHHVILDGSATTGSLRLAGGHGNDTLTGGAGSNVLLGGDGNDTIHGGTGDNIVSGGQGTNTLIFTNWTAGDDIANGALVFDGDFSAGVTIAAGQTAGVGRLTVAAGHDYNITLGAGNTIADVGADALGAANALTLTVNGAPHLMDISGGAGDDVILVTNGINANFNFTQGGDDTVTGSTLADTFTFGNALTAADTVDGGGGADTLSMNGGVSFTFGASTIQNIATLNVGAGTTTFVENDGNVLAGHTMTVVFADTSVNDITTFNGAAETDGNFVVKVRANPQSLLTGGAGNDTFAVSFASVSDVYNTGDVFNGGAGNDTLDIDSISARLIKLGNATMNSIETLIVGSQSAIVTADANVPAGQTLNVVMQGGKFNGAKETNGTFHITGDGISVVAGAGDDTISLTGNQGSGNTEHIQGGGGADTMTFDSINGEHVEFTYTAVSDSTSTAYDSITETSSEIFQMPGAVTGVDAHVTSGALSTASFDTDLAADIGAGQLGAGHAVIFTASSGTLSGQSFLIVDANGVAGYQAGQDFVINVEPGTTVTTASFVT